MSFLPENAAHWHLVLNHLPVVGSLAAALLLIWAFIKNSDDLKRVALAAVILSALTAIPVFLTGEPAEHALKGLPGISKRWISNHEEMGELAMWVSVGVGAVALAALVVFRKLHSIPRWCVGAVLALNLTVCVLMVRTANFGGRIHHPEIRTYNPSENSPTAVEY